MYRPRAFTLIEMLVVIAIIATLMSFLMGGLMHAKTQAAIATTKADIDNLKAALAQYHADTRRTPTPPRMGDTPAEVMRDASPWLFAGLMFKPTVALGGGPNAPYLESWSAIGWVVDKTKLEADTMGKDGLTGVERLPKELRDQIWLKSFQAQHGPNSARPLVFLDAWGNPYHCRFWSSVRNKVKTRLLQNPIVRIGFSAHPHAAGQPLVDSVPDRPHVPHGVDIWSNGPNGINEYGAGDDITSW